MKIAILAILITFSSGCTIELFRENPLNGCSSRLAGRWCSPSVNDVKQEVITCGAHKVQ